MVGQSDIVKVSLAPKSPHRDPLITGAKGLYADNPFHLVGEDVTKANLNKGRAGPEVSPARKAYNEALASARKAYEEAVAAAEKALNEAWVAARKAYDEEAVE